MQRETFEVTTSGGVKAVLHSYITGAEKRKIGQFYIDFPEGQSKSALSFGGADLTLGIVLKELNGSSENMVTRLLDLPSEEVEEISNAVKDVVEGKKK